MIKNLIFDLDDTIIKFEESASLGYKEALKKLGYKSENYLEIYNIIDLYEKSFTEQDNYYNKNELIKYMNNKLNTNYKVELIDEINKVIKEYCMKKIMINKETLKYLSEKYNLYIFSNWFENTQIERLKQIGYFEYFKYIFCSDKWGSKPFKSSYLRVLEKIGTIPKECIMIGDDKKIDVLGANNIGMKAILIDYNGKRDKKEIIATDYIKINNSDELKNIL